MEDGICCIKGCDKPVLAMGMCVNHWRMNKKHGSPVAERPLSAANRGLPAEDRFFKNVHKSDDGCWIWQASVDEDGYGNFAALVNGVKVTKAHRFSYMHHTGEVLTPFQLVMHSCDNPPCVNPDHLSPGSAAENTNDMIRKGRHIEGRKIHSAKVSKLSDDEVRELLADPRPYEEIARAYGIHKQHVNMLKNRKRRLFVEIDPALIVKNKRGAAGEKRSKNLKDQDVRDIRSSTEKVEILAERHKTTKGTIYDIRKGRSWKHVT
jgi:hypothetical protein